MLIFTESNLKILLVIIRVEQINLFLSLDIIIRYLGDNFEDTVSRAPGDNDNASVATAILEIARILFLIDSKYTIRFVLFSEEQGLRDSEHYAYAITRKNEDFSLIITYMIGSTDYHVLKYNQRKEDRVVQQFTYHALNPSRQYTSRVR